MCIVRLAFLAMLLSSTHAAENERLSLPLAISWGQRSPQARQFYIKLIGSELSVTDLRLASAERSDSLADNLARTTAGAGHADRLSCRLSFAPKLIEPITNAHRIWKYLLEHTDAGAAQRLHADPAYRPDPRKLTVQLNEAGTAGFSLTADQLLTQGAFWFPQFDLFISAGDAPVTFSAHQQALSTSLGQCVLDRVAREPEASYEQFTNRWEDMSHPAYHNPDAVPPGHLVGLTWDSALYKFGVERLAGVVNDYGKLDRFRLAFGFGAQAPDLASAWKSQRLVDGLPLLLTTFEKDGVRCEVEQFAFPLEGPPAERRGDLNMVLFQKIRLTELAGRPLSFPLRLLLERPISAPSGRVRTQTLAGTVVLEDVSGRILLAIQSPESAPITRLDQPNAKDPTVHSHELEFPVTLPAFATQEVLLKLPSPPVSTADRPKLLGLDFATARTATSNYWSEYLGRGAQFNVPEPAVNALFRANLWHALSLPRRHGASASEVAIDLPYSNFAYDQKGTPWPVNQAVYVDYMLYDLRGYHQIAAEELAVMFRNNQEPNGHVGGFAPLNDLSHEPRAWAFNQAYFVAGLDLLGRALTRIKHPRAAECRAAAQNLRAAIEREFGRASVRSPAVQLADGTWSAFVPSEAQGSGRDFQVWYPTEVDTGPLHLARLNALAPFSPLTTAMLYDHEDNLFLRQWGAANEPVYNMQGTVYLLRDEPKAALRTFYSTMACAFSHSTFQPVEHRWSWGQYFGPPSTDGSWFELYRNLLIHEREDDSLILCQATPRAWLEDNKHIEVRHAPTYFGPVSFTVESHATAHQITATVDLSPGRPPSSLCIRFRHPETKPIRSATVNGLNWTDWDVAKEWVRLPRPDQTHFVVIARY